MILCCGEALIDMLPEQSAAGRAGFVPHVGGAIFNTAIALGRLGAPSGMLTGLSTDMFGQQLSAALAASKVDQSHVIRSPRLSTLAFVQITDGHATYVFYDENSAGRMIAPADMPALGADVQALYFGGISLACEPAADAYAALLEREGAGRAVMIDPNIRPGFIADPARYRARLTRMLAAADIVKVSDDDLDWIDGSARSLQAKADALLALGPRLVIVTRGKDGAAGYLRSGAVVTVPARAAEVVDTVGAGDTFNAAVLCDLARQGVLSKQALAALEPQSAQSAMQFGAKVAAITVARAGANPPWADEL